MEPEELASALKRLADWAAEHAPEPEPLVRGLSPIQLVRSLHRSVLRMTCATTITNRDTQQSASSCVVGGVARPLRDLLARRPCTARIAVRLLTVTGN